MRIFGLDGLKKDFSIGSLLIQIIAVIIAVVLGFIVNQWRERGIAKSRLEHASTLIANEIILNHRLTRERQDYYSGMAMILDSVIQSRGDVPLTDVNLRRVGWRGLNPPLLSESSFDLASAQGVFADMAFDDAETIEKVYYTQHLFNRTMDTSIGALLNGNLKTCVSMDYVIGVLKELSAELNAQYDSIEKSTLKKYPFSH